MYETCHPLLQSALDVAKYLGEAYSEPVTVGITDTEKYLFYQPTANLDHKIQPGDLIPKGSIAEKVLQEKKPVSRRVGPEVFGVPYMATAVPILDERNRVIGGILLGNSLKKQETIRTMSEHLSASAQQLNAGSQNLTASAHDLSEIANKVFEKSANISNDIKQTDQIISVIKEVATQTHILGLNATIEAARVGQAGKGFNVVAEEIRKLSANATKSTAEIAKILSNMKQAVTQISEQISHISTISEEQAAATGEISESANQLTNLALELNSLAKTL